MTLGSAAQNRRPRIVFGGGTRRTPLVHFQPRIRVKFHADTCTGSKLSGISKIAPGTILAGEQNHSAGSRIPGKRCSSTFPVFAQRPKRMKACRMLSQRLPITPSLCNADARLFKTSPAGTTPFYRHISGNTPVFQLIRVNHVLLTCLTFLLCDCASVTKR